MKLVERAQSVSLHRQPIFTDAPLSEAILTAQYAPNGGRLAVGLQNGSVKLHSFETGASTDLGQFVPNATGVSGERRIRFPIWLSDEELLVAVSYSTPTRLSPEGRAQSGSTGREFWLVFDVITQEVRRVVPRPADYYYVGGIHAGRWIVHQYTGDNALRTFDPDTGRVSEALPFTVVEDHQNLAIGGTSPEWLVRYTLRLPHRGLQDLTFFGPDSHQIVELSDVPFGGNCAVITANGGVVISSDGLDLADQRAVVTDVATGTAFVLSEEHWAPVAIADSRGTLLAVERHLEPDSDPQSVTFDYFEVRINDLTAAVRG